MEIPVQHESLWKLLYRKRSRKGPVTNCKQIGGPARRDVRSGEVQHADVPRYAVL